MKQKFLLVLIVLIVIVISGIFLKGVIKEEGDKDNYGRVIGQVVDAETGKPVHEKFSLYLYASDGGFISYITESDQNGHFILNWKPGQFFIASKPETHESEYCLEFHPFRTPEIQTGFMIERGKITRVTKRIIKGGKMKITLVDPTGSPINPGILFKNIDIRADLFNISVDDDSKFRQIGKLESGVANLIGIWPGVYNLDIDFIGMGYGGMEKQNIVVESKRTTEVKVVIDLNNKTGVHGRVFDKNGIPLEGMEVELSGEKGGTAIAFTDNSGYYKIIGIRPGCCRISFTLYYWEKGRCSYSPPSDEISIKENMFTSKDKILDINKADYKFERD